MTAFFLNYKKKNFSFKKFSVLINKIEKRISSTNKHVLIIFLTLLHHFLPLLTLSVPLADDN